MKFVLSTLLTVVCALCSTVRAANPDPKLAGLRERWLAAMQELGIPGAAVVVVRGDEVILRESMGITSIDTHQPVDADSMFYIASCTKSYMAMTVLTLVEEGKIELDAPVRKYLPQFQSADAELSEKLTIRDLLSHAKGLDSGEITFGEAYSGQMTEERYWQLMKQAKASGRFKYTNLHYTILGRVVQQVSGAKWQDAIEQRVCKPAGMNRTTAYASRMYGDPNSAIPMIYWDKKLIIAPQRKTDRTMHAAGGMGATANDLGRWLRLNLNGGMIDGKQVLSTPNVEQMQTIQATSDRRSGPVPDLFRLGYGLGWDIGEYRGRKIIQHGGGYVGTAALVMMLPEEKLGIAVVVNTDGPGAPFSSLAMVDVFDRMLGIDPPLDLLEKIRPMHERFLQRRAEQAAVSTQPLVADALSLPMEKYVGTYVSNALGTLVIEQNSGRLVLRLGDIRPELFATDQPDRFTTAFSGGVFDGGKFEMVDGAVRAVILRSENDEMRFVRQ